jgi:flagellar M-ring protein FliF
MNFLQKITEPLRDAFFAMPVASRMIAGMLIATIAIGLGLLVKGSSTSEMELLFGGRTFTESEVDSVEMAFSQAGLRAWQREGRRIRIPSGSRNDYLKALRESSTLPLELHSFKQDAMDKASVYESSDQRAARDMLAKAQDLGAKITAFPDVRWASVEYDRGERTGLSRTRPQSASVVVSPEGAEPLSKIRINMIKDLIRGSYAQMASEDVVVIDTNASHGSAGDDEDPMLKKRREEEAAYEKKVHHALVGYGPIRVAAHAELDPTMGVEKATLKYDSERTTLQEYSRKVDSQSVRHGPRGVPGTGPNAISNRGASLDEPEQSAKSKQDERESSGVAGTQYELSKLAALQVRRVRISVGLPSSYYDKVMAQDFLRENPDKTLADMPQPSALMMQQKRSDTEDKIKAAVTQLLPLAPPGEDPLTLVHVWDYPDLPETAVANNNTSSAAMTWLSNSWPTLAMLGLAFIAIFVARSALLGTSKESSRGFEDGFGLQLPVPPKNETASVDNELEGMQITGGSLRDELLRMVEKNPEVAANVLRGWITDAA